MVLPRGHIVRNRKDRRRARPDNERGYRENGREVLAKERRKGRDRRKENLRFEERLLELGEMPGINRDRGA
jgi:hypothetical protein